MHKRISHLLTVAALLVVFALTAFVSLTPAQAADVSTGCAYWDAKSGYGSGTQMNGWGWSAGETIAITVTGLTGKGETLSLKVDDVVQTTTTVDGTLFYTFPTTGTPRVVWQVSNGVKVNYVQACGVGIAPAPASNPAPVGGTLAEPFFQNSLPAQGIHLDIARETPYMGQLPLDVFEPHWWGVKSLNAARFPKLAGIDLTTVEVLCMDSAGNWSGEWVSEWRVTETVHEVLIKQHGICGIFPK